MAVRFPSDYSCAVSELPQALHAGSPSEIRDRIAAERHGAPFVLYRDELGQQRIIELERAGSRVSVGRQPASDIPLPWDSEVSRLHAELELIAGRWTVVDDGRSRNGSFLNGERIQGRCLLEDGDVMVVGRTVLVYYAPNGEESVRTTRPGVAARLVPTGAQQRVLVALCRPFASSSFAAPASNRAIADELVISTETVKTHLRTLFDAFGIGDLPQNQKRAELARAALQRGVVTVRDLDSRD
jgi:pSer/pThr/pTyr-binding forkhead associated (FHA) protein